MSRKKSTDKKITGNDSLVNDILGDNPTNTDIDEPKDVPDEIEYISEIKPENKKKAKATPKLVGKRVINKILANTTAQGSYGDECIRFEVQFNEEGISEPIKQTPVYEKLLATGSVPYKKE